LNRKTARVQSSGIFSFFTLLLNAFHVAAPARQRATLAGSALLQAWSSQWQRQRDMTRRKPRHETTGGEARLEPRISSRDNRHANAVAVTLLPLPPPHEPERAPRRRVPRQPTAPNYSTRRDPEFMGSSDTDDTNMVTLAGPDHALRQ
jgi:hypothetical protein